MQTCKKKSLLFHIDLVFVGSQQHLGSSLFNYCRLFDQVRICPSNKTEAAVRINRPSISRGCFGHSNHELIDIESYELCTSGNQKTLIVWDKKCVVAISETLFD
jgi:hypothetical protein